VRGWVGERADDPEQLDDRAGPAVRDDQWQRVLVPRLHMDEVDGDPVDLRLELREGVQPRLNPPEVVLGVPVARERLQRYQLHALRPIVDELLAGPARRGDAAPQFGDLLLPDLDLKRADPGGGSDGAAHDDSFRLPAGPAAIGTASPR